MSSSPPPSPQVVRIASPGLAAFQLRKGEEGVSVFDPEAVDPPLTEKEVLDSFRPGSLPVVRSQAGVASRGLQVVVVEGAEALPERLRKAHREIRPGPGMTREQFKKALRELE